MIHINPFANTRFVALGDIGEPAKTAVPELIQALRDGDQDIRANAAIALANIGAPARDAVPALIDALRDESERVCEYSAFALQRIGTPAAKKALNAL